jgi:hypothetical protein
VGRLSFIFLAIALLGLVVGLALCGSGADGAAVQMTPVAGAADKEFSPATTTKQRQQVYGVSGVIVPGST